MIKVIDNIKLDFKAPITKSLIQATQLVRTRAIKNAPVKSGTLRRSITTDFARITKGEGVIGTNVKYAAIQEYGGVIRPVNAKFLTFKINGKWVRTKRVNIKGKRYMTRALNSSIPQIKSIFLKNLTDV